MKRGIVLSLFILMLGAHSTQAQLPPCIGDCNGDGTVAVDELIRGIRFALGTTPIDQCDSFDADAGGTVTVDELITAVSKTLYGCDFGPIAIDRASLCFSGFLGFEPTGETVMIVQSEGSWQAETADPWVSVAPPNGNGPASFEVHVDPAQLTDGSYGSEIILQDSGQNVARVKVELNIVAPGVSEGWQVETIQPVAARRETTSLALDDLERPGIAFFGEGGLWYAHWNGCRWVSEFVEKGSSIQASLAFDSRGLPHVSFFTAPDRVLRYGWRTDAGWTVTTVDEPVQENLVGFRPSLVLDGQDLPHISYQTKGPHDLRYAAFDGEVWHIETVDEEIRRGITGWNSSLALTPSGRPGIAYHTDPSALLYAELGSDGWQIEQIDFGGNPPSLKFDSAERPLIAHRSQVLPNRELHYVFRDDDGQWQIEPIDPQGFVRDLACASLALDSLERPHIAYANFLTSSLNYASQAEDGSWEIVIVDQDIDGDLGDHCSLDIDSQDTAHISYLDVQRGILKYAQGPAY